MKIFKLMMVAFVAMLAFTACEKDCDHDFIEHDYSNDILGTWTCLKDGFAEALVFKADGTFESVGVANGEYWEYPDAIWSLKNNKLALSSGDYKSNVLLEIIPGNSLALVDEKGTRNVFNYCANDLSDEIIGMWVCNDGPSDKETDMVIQTFNEDGTVTKTGWSVDSNEFIVEEALTYKVVGDLLFHQRPLDMVTEGVAANFASKLTYMPNANQLGDMLTNTTNKVVNGKVVELSMSMLRVKQNLDLANMSYDYISCYITNAKGEDKDIKFLNTTFNFAKMDGSIIDKFLRSILFSVNFPDANTIEYRCLLEGNYLVSVAPIEVEGNKMTLKMSSRHEAYRDVEIYTFQDADNTQMHMYMPTTSFENFFSNMSLSLLSSSGQVDINNPVHVEAVYKEVADAVESINLSIVCKNTTARAL